MPILAIVYTMAALLANEESLPNLAILCRIQTGRIDKKTPLARFWRARGVEMS
jgi:hypothetical protein